MKKQVKIPFTQAQGKIQNSIESTPNRGTTLHTKFSDFRLNGLLNSQKWRRFKEQD